MSSSAFILHFEFSVMGHPVYIEEPFDGTEEQVQQFCVETWQAEGVTFPRTRSSYPVRSLQSIWWEAK